jgi:hypothetical protein
MEVGLKKQFVIITLVLSLCLLSACVDSKPTPTGGDQLSVIRTVAASTIEAMTTSIVATDLAAQAALQQTATAQPSALPTVSSTQAENPTPTPDQEPTAAPTNDQTCNLAGFVDETIADGSQFYPGTAFTKTWTLRNEGTCTWTIDYSLVFVSGSSMGAPASQPISDKPVAPGQTVVISVPFVAPAGAGAYKAEFKLRTAEGVIFAFKNPDATFWAEIQVRGDSINLADSYCSATWTSPTGTLHCPGQPGDTGGFVYSDNNPILEDGYQDDETALWLGLYNADQAYLKGTFPAMIIPANAHFRAILGCRRGNTACDVNFSLKYEDSSGNVYELKTWRETFDQKHQTLDVDLASLGGRQVKIILVLDANGSPSGDVIHLLQPVIEP